MNLHPSTFAYHKPTAEQLKQMEEAREAAMRYAHILEALLPEGPDKTWVLRNHRTTAMWANIAITRHPDGCPRD